MQLNTNLSIEHYNSANQSKSIVLALPYSMDDLPTNRASVCSMEPRPNAFLMKRVITRKLETFAIILSISLL